MATTSNAHERTPLQGASQNPRALHWAALIAGNVALALGPWSVRLADSGPVSAGFWRLVLALPIIWLIARSARQPVLGVPRRTACVECGRAAAHAPCWFDCMVDIIIADIF